MVGEETGFSNAPSAVLTISALNFRSYSAGNVGSPHGCGIFLPTTTREAPTCCASWAIAEMTVTVMPLRSNSFASAAPQRVQVPQVATRSAAPTFASSRDCAISSPTRLATARLVPTPVTE
jgi:hypothetical protein